MFFTLVFLKLDNSNGGESIVLWHEHLGGVKPNKNQHKGDSWKV